ncbi:MAG: hypothetical protein HY289_01070 [Planctomycetes bacterium]|nr:hypothetical protein [Planctomycetota bacterium]
MDTLRQSETAAGVVRSRDAFLRALPELLANPKYDGWCVGYCGDEQIGIAESETEVVQECRRRGLPVHECHIGWITRTGEEEEEIEGGLSFVEYDDDDGQFYGPAVNNPYPKS